ncbi:MAG: cupin domain-containing protein [Cyanobacteria bacterium J06638_28]
MAKSTATYWNPLQIEHSDRWTVVEGTRGMIEQLFLAIDDATGDFTRLTRFKAGADIRAFGPQVHDYPEEIFIISGQLYDQAFDRWLEAGEYASRPPGEVHGPFVAKTNCLVLDCSYPSLMVES